TAHDHPGRQGPRYLAQQRQRRVAAQDPQGSRFAIVGLPEENESRAVGPGGKAVSPEAAAGRVSIAAAEPVLFFVNGWERLLSSTHQMNRRTHRQRRNTPRGHLQTQGVRIGLDTYG